MLTRLRELPLDRHAIGAFKVARWATPDEAHALYVLLQAHRIRTYLECGTANGYTALWAAAADVEHIHTWDVEARHKVWEKFPELKCERIITHVGPYHEGLGTIYAPSPRLYFIDGDHETAAVERDWDWTRRTMEAGDVVVFHDMLGYAGIGALVRRLLTKYRGGVIRTPRGMGVLFA